MKRNSDQVGWMGEERYHMQTSEPDMVIAQINLMQIRLNEDQASQNSSLVGGTVGMGKCKVRTVAPRDPDCRKRKVSLKGLGNKEIQCKW